MQKLFLDGYMGLGAVRICYSLYSRLQNNSPCCWLSIKHENSTERVFVYMCVGALSSLKQDRLGQHSLISARSIHKQNKDNFCNLLLYWTSIRGNVLK